MKQRVGTFLVAGLLLAGCSSQAAQDDSTIDQTTVDQSPIDQTTVDYSTMPVPSLAPGMATAAPGGGSFLAEKIPADVLALPLFDGAGRTISLASYAGKYVVIANFLTSCHEICPMTTVNMRDIAISVAAAGLSPKISVVEISVDGERDTAMRLAAYQALFNNFSWTMAGGSSQSLASLWKYFGAPATKEEYKPEDVASMPKDWQTGQVDTFDMTHSNVVIIIGPDSTWRWLDLGSPKTKDGKVPAPLMSYLSAAGKANLAAPEGAFWTVGAVLAALSSLTGQKLS